MKFTKLGTKFNKLLKKKKQGKNIKPAKIKKLLELLGKKKLRYEEKLKTNLSDEKRKSFKSKLKVVDAQIEKSKKLILDQTS